MKVTLANGTVFDNVSNVEEVFSSRMDRGTTLSVRMKSNMSVDQLREAFAADATAAITVNDGEKDMVISGYTVLDSIRKFYDGKVDYNTAIDLLKGEHNE